MLSPKQIKKILLTGVEECSALGGGSILFCPVFLPGVKFGVPILKSLVQNSLPGMSELRYSELS